MCYYVYIIVSEVDGTFYKGSCADYEKRLAEHNAGLSRYTSAKVLWRLFYIELHSNKKEPDHFRARVPLSVSNAIKASYSPITSNSTSATLLLPKSMLALKVPTSFTSSTMLMRRRSIS